MSGKGLSRKPVWRYIHDDSERASDNTSETSNYEPKITLEHQQRNWRKKSLKPCTSIKSPPLPPLPTNTNVQKQVYPWAIVNK